MLVLGGALPMPSFGATIGIIMSTAGVGLLEALTTQMDNIFLPLVYFTLLMTCRAL